MYDIIIAGGGPAGLTASLYAQRERRSTLILEKNGMGGQIVYSPKVENFPGFLSVSGNELADRLTEQVIEQGADIEIDCVTEIRDCGEYKEVHTESGVVFEGRAVILATGVKHRMLGLDGEYALVGEGISFCATCDGAYYRDKTVAVIGGGNSALQEAMLLAENCSHVIVLQDLEHFTGEAKLAEELLKNPKVSAVFGVSVIEYLVSEGELTGVRIRERETGTLMDVVCDGVFLAVGLQPENEAFQELILLDEQGYIDADEHCFTNRQGVFAAGDCRTKEIRQLVTACADGAAAALAACRFLDGR